MAIEADDINGQLLPSTSDPCADEERAYESDEKVLISISDEDSDLDPDMTPPFSWRKLWRFTGPGFLMCIAFLDPGNLEGDLQAGAIAGYSLLWLLMWATVVGLLIQLLSARLGVATGRHLAELCREEYPKWAGIALWIMAELALIGADIQEVIGSAIAIKILSGGIVPLWAGVIITALDCFIFLFLENYGVRKLEAFFGVLIATMAVSFAIMFGETKPSAKELLIGVVVPKLGSRTIKQAVGVVGCLIMPHNVFLHSALVQSRRIDTSKRGRVQEALNYYAIESAAALFISFIINVLVTTVFAKSFYGTDVASTIGLENAGQFLQEKYGAMLFPILYIWGLGLLASGQFKYSGEDGGENAEAHAFSTEFNSMVRARKNVQQLISWIEESIIPAHGYKVAVEVVIQTLLDIGSKSFTHLITVLERYGQIISKLCPDHDTQILLISHVSSYWKNSSQMTATTIDRMMGYRLISNLVIVSWVFSPSNVDQFHLSDRPWEILRNAINKTCNRITDLRKEILSLQKNISLAEAATIKAQKELDAVESKLEVVDGQPIQAANSGRLKRLKGYAAKARDEEVSLRESLEAKDALFSRALEENKALFLSLYKNLRDVLKERLPPVSADGKLPNLKAAPVDSMAVDTEEPPAMEVDNENGNTDIQTNGERTTDGYKIGEQEQWCLTTLGYVKAFSRQYATEIWPHIEVLDAEVFVEDVHPLFRKAAYTGLCRRS